MNCNHKKLEMGSKLRTHERPECVLTLAAGIPQSLGGKACPWALVGAAVLLATWLGGWSHSLRNMRAKQPRSGRCCTGLEEELLSFSTRMPWWKESVRNLSFSLCCLSLSSAVETRAVVLPRTLGRETQAIWSVHCKHSKLSGEGPLLGVIPLPLSLYLSLTQNSLNSQGIFVAFFVFLRAFVHDLPLPGPFLCPSSLPESTLIFLWLLLEHHLLCKDLHEKDIYLGLHPSLSPSSLTSLERGLCSRVLLPCFVYRCLVVLFKRIINLYESA